MYPDYEEVDDDETNREGESYDREGDVVPPDGSWTQMTVTVAERTQSVRWAGGAELPQILVRFNCWLDSARGSLIACP
jgi:hypothetical protein